MHLPVDLQQAATLQVIGQAGQEFLKAVLDFSLLNIDQNLSRKVNKLFNLLRKLHKCIDF
jgi:hypothetical protein